MLSRMDDNLGTEGPKHTGDTKQNIDAPEKPHKKNAGNKGNERVPRP